MVKLLLDVMSSLRTRRRQDVYATTQAVLERVGRDAIFAPLIDSYIYTTTHHYRPRSDPFDWQTTPKILLEDLVGEPRASIGLAGSDRSAGVSLRLNCEDEIIKEKLGGRWRKVPKASETSRANVNLREDYFSDPTFTQAYINLAADIFEIIGGEYGWAEYLSIQHGTDFDRARSNFFDPWFITWANFFGPELVSHFGRERLLSAPAHQVIELPGGSVVLTVAASPLKQLEPEVQQTIARVKAHLGILSPSERATAEELAAFEARSAARQAELKQRIEEAFRHAREETAAEMRRQAEGCVEGVWQFWRERLDFSPESLAIVDRLIATGFDAQEDEETIQTAVQAFGAYVGEVVRQHLGGVWQDEEMRRQPVLLGVGGSKQRLRPFEAVRRRFERRQGGGFTLAQWFEAVRQGTVE